MKRILVLYPGLGARGARYLAPHRWKLRLAGIGIVLAAEHVPLDSRSA